MHIAALVIFLLILLVALFTRTGTKGYESPEKRAGRRGERFTYLLLTEIAHEDDVILSNVPVHFDGQETELDNVVINQRGVFIIETKNWSGEIIGGEDDRDWIHSKYSSGGNFYQKTEENPFKQLKREIYLTAGLLKSKGIKVWVEGYVFFVEDNCPIESELLLRNQRDMDRVIHGGTDNKLTARDRAKIIKALER